MNPVGWQSIDDPYTNSHIVDTTAMTLDAMRSYLLSDEVRNDVANDVPLIIYLLGHGSATTGGGKFYLGPDQVLTPDTLAAWLNAYGDLSSGNSQIVVILDFCYSGEFQSKLRTMYTQNRAIVSASDGATPAYFVRGRCFSWHIWYDVYKGRDLATAFGHARDWSEANKPGANFANPQINCDNNGQYTTAADLAVAGDIYIGGN
jgi:hypothetical protein